MKGFRWLLAVVLFGTLGRDEGRQKPTRGAMNSLLRCSRPDLGGWNRRIGVVLFALMTGAFVFRSNAFAEDIQQAISPDLSAGSCSSTTTTLCLSDNRFSVAVSWRVPEQGRSGNGTSVALSGDTGLFWFFDASNIELVVKLLDGTAVNGSYWLFYAGLSDVEYTITVIDLKTGRFKAYDNQNGTFASVADTSAFADAPGDTAAPAEAEEEALQTRSSRELYALFEALSETTRAGNKTAAPCAPGGATLCLAGSRFQVTVDWEIPAQGRSGQASAVPISTDTGYFWFFNDANVEVAVKVLDGRAINGHFWIFVAALSNLKYTLRVTDTQTGMTKGWDNSEGQLASWADTGEFSDSTIPVPPPQGLSGRWTGTIAFYNPPHGFGHRCQDSASIIVDLVESGERLTAQFQAGCSGTFLLRGRLQGTTLSGSLEGGAGQGTIFGTVSSDRIQFQAISDSYDPYRDRDARFTSSKVDLSR